MPKVCQGTFHSYLSRVLGLTEFNSITFGGDPGADTTHKIKNEILGLGLSLSFSAIHSYRQSKTEKTREPPTEEVDVD